MTLAVQIYWHVSLFRRIITTFNYFLHALISDTLQAKWSPQTSSDFEARVDI